MRPRACRAMSLTLPDALARVHFPVKKAMAQSRNYSLVQLEAIMDRLLTADVGMKTGADPATELDILVAELTRPRKRN